MWLESLDYSITWKIDPDLERFRALVLWLDFFNWNKEEYIKTAFPDDLELQKSYLENTNEYRERLDKIIIKKSKINELNIINELVLDKVLKLLDVSNLIIK